jgi:L-alanine-DL-glutamate epimerase-like enolase superfamily enzyme
MTHERALDAIARAHGGTRAAGTGGDAATADYIAARLGVPVGGLFTGELADQDPRYHRACGDLSNVDAAALHEMTDAAEAVRELTGAD